jgi:ankyrin repeat protein
MELLVCDHSRRGNTAEVLELLQEHPQLVNRAASLGNTPLHCAASSGHAECVEELLGVGADPNLVNSAGDTALHIACWRGHVEVVRVLLRSKLTSTSVLNGSGAVALDMCRDDDVRACFVAPPLMVVVEDE